MSSTHAERHRNAHEAKAYLAEKFGISVAIPTLNKMRSVGGGPGFRKFGHSVLYPESSLDTWATEKLGPVLSSTSDGSKAKPRAASGAAA